MLERAGEIGLRAEYVPDPLVTHREVDLPAHVVRNLDGQRLAELQRLAEVDERCRGLAAGALHLANLVVADCETSAHLRVGRRLGDEALADREARTILRQRRRVAERRHHTCHLAVAIRELDLHPRVRGRLRREPLADRMGGSKLRERAFGVASGPDRLAERLAGGGPGTLPVDILRIDGDQMIRDRERCAKLGARAGRVALVEEHVAQIEQGCGATPLIAGAAELRPRLVVVARLLRDGVEHLDAADRSQLVPEIEQHEVQQLLGLALECDGARALVLGLSRSCTI